jgi:hypothetical protein
VYESRRACLQAGLDAGVLAFFQACVRVNECMHTCLFGIRRACLQAYLRVSVLRVVFTSKRVCTRICVKSCWSSGVLASRLSSIHMRLRAGVLVFRHVSMHV